MTLRLLVVALGFACATGPAFAWVYPEHRDIAVLGIESLDVHAKRYSISSGPRHAAATRNACASKARTLHKA